MPFIFISMPVETYDKVQRTRVYSILCIQYIERFARFDLDIYGVVDSTAGLYHFHFCLLEFQPSYTNEKEVKAKKSNSSSSL